MSSVRNFKEWYDGAVNALDWLYIRVSIVAAYETSLGYLSALCDEQ